MITLKEAIARKIFVLRNPKWKHPMDHLALDPVLDNVGPWAHLWSPFNQGQSIDFLIWRMEAYHQEMRCWEAYNGPESGSQEFQDECRKCYENR